MLYLTHVDYDIRTQEAIYAPDAGAPGRFRTVGHIGGGGTITLEMQMDMTPGSRQIVDTIWRAGGKLAFGQARQEYRCIWCGVCNPVERPLCSQCGGPRGWIL